ncbi:MAG: LysM peptidoglycan-binding domain-containing protein [Kribbellaceae bacterium]
MSAVVAAPESTGTREATRPRRVALVGPTTESLPVRACSAEEIGWQPVADRPALRLTRRGRRLVTAVSALVFGAAVFVVGQQAVASINDEPRFTRTTSVQVGAGQNLWSIAEETNPGVDPRVVIEEIADLNGLRSAADVIPGQTLVVPAP